MTWQIAWGDVDIQYGGLFVSDNGSWAEVIEVIDLDSAAGTTGMVLVERGTCSIEYAGGFAQQRKRLETAMRDSLPLAGLTRERRRAMAYAALWAYGHRDVDESIVLTTDPDASEKQDGWVAEGHVAGSVGLAEWLWDRFALAV